MSTTKSRRWQLIRDTATKLYHQPRKLFIPPGAEIYEATSGTGYWVAAWVWVPKEKD